MLWEQKFKYLFLQKYLEIHYPSRESTIMIIVAWL